MSCHGNAVLLQRRGRVAYGLELKLLEQFCESHVRCGAGPVQTRALQVSHIQNEVSRQIVVAFAIKIKLFPCVL